MRVQLYIPPICDSVMALNMYESHFV
ncbi:hypothetical protein F383_27118 [Gossypium arboreum]|uniref:Uncharacterized protein n=1 Tax=Gossypium arboreum TaxID=29729 RepID=A0A0B0P7W9_GOSAR|nr:hypothetical protein F383_27118 [Gossypium arboreum]